MSVIEAVALSFEKVELAAVPLDPSGYLLVDIFVRLPSQERYVRFILAGEIITEEKKAALVRHVDPGLYIRVEKSSAPVATPAPAAPSSAATLPGLQTLNEDQAEAISNIAKDLLSGNGDPAKQMSALAEQADSIMNVVAPDVKDLKDHLMKTSKFLDAMHDSGAISTLSVIFAIANGFDSKKSFRDLAMATLVMDAALAEFSEPEIKQYYIDRTQLPPETLQRFLKHPARSHELAREKLASLSEGTMVLILSHHELYNGKGYPRGIRSESLFPLVKVLAFAVDVYESIKRAKYLNESLSLFDAVYSFRDTDVESHLRRHSKAMVDKILKYFDINAAS